ncbi:Calcium-activated chloride channel regulator 1 [Chionoecetes opilio]|uniref:Calcium-activated chloride channel regulator 1 n=1 Tax=Chionoecetes opilio TaxID=41210 RepID=A0A8J4Y228_CHIOP|nr:Calcium-activated chloride channel regulator 1 [Chionoecetes opilio]
MGLAVWLCAAAAAVMGAVAAIADVEQREVRRNSMLPPVLEESLTHIQDSPHYTETRGLQRARQNTHSTHHMQEEPNAILSQWPKQRLRGRYSSPGDHMQPLTAVPHQSITRRPLRITTIRSPVVRDSVHDPLPASGTADVRFSSRQHQGNLEASTTNSQRLPYVRGSYDPRVPPSSRDRLQRPHPEQRIKMHDRESHDDARAPHASSATRHQGHSGSLATSTSAPRRGHQGHRGSLATSSRSEERPAHHRYRTPNTHSRLGLTEDPSMAAAITGELSREVNVAGELQRTQHGVSKSDVRQRVDQPDLCCGSRVPFDPHTGQPTGAFGRVVAAGSIKVVDVPVRGSLPPNNVRDLQATPLGPHTLYLNWTAPGQDLDSGTASGYIIRLSEARNDLQEPQFDAAPEETILETSEALADAGVYQAAGTRVSVEVPLARRLERGHVYYVAFKAVDNDGYSSGVSNMAQFSIPKSFAAVSYGMATRNNAGAHSILEAADTSNMRGSVIRNGEITVFSESPTPSLTRDSNTASEPEAEPRRSRNREEQSLPFTPADPQECEPTLPSRQEERDPVSLCEAQNSLAIAITYFAQNNEHQYLDYLSAALHTLEQKLQPSWRTES